MLKKKYGRGRVEKKCTAHPDNAALSGITPEDQVMRTVYSSVGRAWAEACLPPEFKSPHSQFLVYL
jgi:hypothetical protein